MPEHDSADEAKKHVVPGHPPDGPEQAEPEHEAKAPARKKSAENKETKEHKEHKESRDHLKIKALRAEIEELNKTLEGRNHDVEAARAEAGEWKDKALRTLADTDNLRKRLEREKSEFLQFSLADILKDILPIIDNLERALRTQDSPEGLREGVELIWKQMSDLAAKRGVTPIPETEGRFDPSFHHALSTEETEGITEPMIGEMLQRGYMLNDRLLRPALVKVLVPKKD